MPALTKRKRGGDGQNLLPHKRMKMELQEEERIEQGGGVPLMAAEASLVFSDGEGDGGVPLAPAAVVRMDGHDNGNDDDDDDFDPNDLDQLPEADDEDADWEEEQEEETAGKTRATRAAQQNPVSDQITYTRQDLFGNVLPLEPGQSPADIYTLNMTIIRRRATEKAQQMNLTI